MKATTSLAALILGATLAGAAIAQTETPPVPAPGGAEESSTDLQQDAASGAAASQTMGETRSNIEATLHGDTPPPAAEAKVLPNGMDATPVEMENGRWMNADGIPVPNIAADGTTDYATFSGFRRYHAECHVCHGPDGEGSTYAPALKDSAVRMDYYDFQQVVASGKQQVNASANQVMPAFGTNRNVWCYIDDIYVYLLARGMGEIPRGRPAKKEAKSDEFAEQENSCMEG